MKVRVVEGDVSFIAQIYYPARVTTVLPSYTTYSRLPAGISLLLGSQSPFTPARSSVTCYDSPEIKPVSCKLTSSVSSSKLRWWFLAFFV